MNGDHDRPVPGSEWLVENPWFDGRYHLDQDAAEMAVMKTHPKSEPEPDPTWFQRVLGAVRRDVGSALMTGWLVVPIWWGLWKVCDAVWDLK